jgi:hypothetical protein
LVFNIILRSHPEHIDLREKLTFLCQGPGNYNCKLTSDEILKNYAGFPSEGAGNNFHNNPYCAFYQLALENSDHSDLIFYDDRSLEAMEYLNLALDLNYPVVVGVNYIYKYDKIKDKQGHNEETTDHFVIIVGRHCEDDVLYYRFWDVGSQGGAKNDYKFKVDNDNHLICEKTYKSTDIKYTITQIRRFNKNGIITLQHLKEKKI